MINMLNFLLALNLFCRDYHSGQWSKGYRLNCLSSRYLSQWYSVSTSIMPSTMDIEEVLGIDVAEIYDSLVDKYCDDV